MGCMSMDSNPTAQMNKKCTPYWNRITARVVYKAVCDQ